MFIEQIKRTRREDVAVFVVVFVIRDERFDVACEAATLLDYARFQRHVLEQTGRVFLCEAAEGREPAVANHLWHVDLRMFIDIEARKAAEAAQHN